MPQGAKTTSASTQSRDYLATAPLGPLMAKLAIPSVVTMVVNLLYTIVDRIFIGHAPSAGADALTGLGVCLPIIMLITAFAAFAAGGGAPLASMALGRGDSREAQRVVATSQTLTFLFACLVMALLYALMPFLLPVFGASAATAPYAQEYLQVYLVGTFFVMVNVGMSAFLLAQGDSTQVLVSTVAGCVVHVALDYLFIFVFAGGIQGAALASIFSQGVCAGMVVFFMRRPASALRFEFRLVRLDGGLVRRIFSIGSGRFFVYATESLLYIVLNSTLQYYGGDDCVGALTILTSVLNLAMAPIQGFTQGTQPIASFCFGAGKIDRVRSTCRWMVGVSAVIEFALIGLAILFPAAFVGLFTSDPAISEIAVREAPVYLFGLLFFGAQLGLQSIFMGLGRGLCSLVVAAVRKCVLFIPLALVLPIFLGADGVFLAEPVSDLVSVVFCSVLFGLTVPKQLRDAESQ